MDIQEKIEYAKLRAEGASLFARDEYESNHWKKAVRELEDEMKRGLCTGKNGTVTATKYCPECGRLGLEFHETGGNHWISGGNIMDDEGFCYVCPTCGYCGDGELVPPEMPEFDLEA